MTVFFRYNRRPEVDNVVISSVAIDYVSMDIRVKSGDSRSNGSGDIRGAAFVSYERAIYTSITEQPRLTN